MTLNRWVPPSAVEWAMLHNPPVMSMTPYAWVVKLMFGWLVTVSLAVVGYLVALQIREIRRNRCMDEQRARLGLRRTCSSFTSWFF